MWFKGVLMLSGVLYLAGCGAGTGSQTAIADGDHGYVVASSSRVPQDLLERAGIQLRDVDLVLNRGFDVDPLAPIPGSETIQLQVLRSSTIAVNGKPLATTAATVGETLQRSGIDLGAVDLLEPDALTPVSESMEIRHVPSREMRVHVDGHAWGVSAATGDVVAALADAGIPILGLDVAWSTEAGDIQFGRISENLELVQEPVPFEVEARDSPELELGLEQVVQAGVAGLNVARTRVRFQDGSEVSRQVDPATIVRPPQNRLVIRGTKVVEKTITVDGVSISYWRMLQMYATVYSPCNSGTADGSCSSGTASGLPAGKGVVAVDPDLFAVLGGQRLYIPGYGYAVIGDVGGGYIVEQQLGISRYKWIDLGFDDNNIQDMSGWITVYFLSPAPAAIPDVLK